MIPFSVGVAVIVAILLFFWLSGVAPGDLLRR